MLFRQRYETLKRAVHYIRWTEGDAVELVPILFAHPRRRRAAARDESAAATPAQDIETESVPSSPRALSDVAEAPAAHVS